MISDNLIYVTDNLTALLVVTSKLGAQGRGQNLYSAPLSTEILDAKLKNKSLPP